MSEQPSLTAIVEALGGKKEGSSYRCDCPVHNGRSLIVTEKPGETILFHCKNGCDQSDVLTALKDRGLWPSTNGRHEATPPNPAPPEPGESLEAKYEYCDTDGTHYATKGRFRTFGGKTFRWRRPDDERWAGLRGLKEVDLPLFGAHLLAESGGPVIFNEGEKATKACQAVGLTAVCAAGSAGQRIFGTALAALKDRDVVLWPDNDDAGRGLMRHIARELDGIAKSVRFVTPDVPAKGDAFDYFGAGGTVDALLDTLAEIRIEPWIEETPDGYIVSLPEDGGTIRFVASSLDSTRGRAPEVMLRVWNEIPGVSNEQFAARLNLVSLSNREAYRRSLDEMFGKEGGWTRRLNRACDMLLRAHNERDDSIVLLEAPVMENAYLIRGFQPADGPAFIFGQGGSGKTYLALYMATCISLGIPFLGRDVGQAAVLYVDYESSPWRLRQRTERILAGMGMADTLPAIFYWPGGGVPLVDMVPALERKIAQDDIGAIFIDSAVLAAGSDPERSETAARYFNALSRLGLPSLTIAHVTKQDDDRYPFGSIFWHNSARLTWNVKLAHDDGDVAHLGLHNRKSNDDKPEPSLGLRVTFGADSGPVTFQREDLASVQGLNKDLPLKTRILAELKAGHDRITIKELAGELDEKEDSVSRTLRRMESAVSVDRSAVPHRYGALDVAR